MTKDRPNYLLVIILMSIFLALVANLGLFLRVNQLQNQIGILLENMSPPKGLEEGISAPVLNLKDLNGIEVSLADFTEKYTLVVFSSTTCSACKRFWPTLQDFHNSNSEINIVMISTGTNEEITQMADRYGFDFPILIWDEEIGATYQVPGTPYLYLISNSQIILVSGFSNELDRIEELIHQPS